MLHDSFIKTNASSFTCTGVHKRKKSKLTVNILALRALDRNEIKHLANDLEKDKLKQLRDKEH